MKSNNKFIIILCMLHLTSTKKNQLNKRNIYSNVIFIDEQEVFYINYNNFQQKIFKGSRVSSLRVRATISRVRVPNLAIRVNLPSVRHC